MLSYRHAFHAGNFADVLKHIVLVEITSHLLKKTKPFDYIETHAGAGMYDFQSYEAGKLSEFKQGIGRLNAIDYPELSQYFELIDSVNDPAQPSIRYYPGSPFFVASMMRPKDRAHLHELHGCDYDSLEHLMLKQHKFAADVNLYNSNGYEGLMRLIPPVSRRAVVLVDPSYEVKAEYQTMIDTVVAAHQKFATGIYALWYPVVDRARITQIDNILYKSGIKDIQRYELGLATDSDGQGMTAAGMWVINPPWGLYEKMQKLLPKLTKDLLMGDDKQIDASHRCEVLVAE